MLLTCIKILFKRLNSLNSFCHKSVLSASSLGKSLLCFEKMMPSENVGCSCKVFWFLFGSCSALISDGESLAYTEGIHREAIHTEVTRSEVIHTKVTHIEVIQTEAIHSEVTRTEVIHTDDARTEVSVLRISLLRLSILRLSMLYPH